MSYDITLNEPDTGKVIELKQPHNYKGGVYAEGLNSLALLNVTWNYSKYYYRFISPNDGIKWLNGKTGEEAAPVLLWAFKKLGNKRSENYWDSTEGNAGAAVEALLYFATERPDGIFRVE